ncbi:EAL domain-containing protein [Sandarakinorhabdus sp. AAP62]|uniref:putative bifunctional diguanylate cyclase/phosphodiesterase n=1 Tax=Sandarakinorhabdus sp. AAP62 TaxID=1248916 RepID=UPI0003650B16|nr:EAL domain-containing protein [Sandarakinorhabdus sp. AAP62]
MRRSWPLRWARNLLGALLPPSLQAELTRDLGNYFLSFVFAGPIAALLAIATALTVQSMAALFFAGLALAGFGFVISACSAVRLPDADVDLEDVESRYVLGTIIVAVGIGGIVTVVLRGPAPVFAQAMAVMVALATLGAANGTGPGRPLIALVQFPAISLPIGLSLIRHWPAPWGIGTGVGVLVFGLLCVAMARRAYATNMQLLLAREAQAAERQRLETAVHTLSQAVTILDADTRVVAVNRSALDLLGVAPIDPANPPTFAELLADAPNLQKAAGNREEFLGHAAMLVGTRQAFNAAMHLDDHRVIDVECQPVPGGGWVTVMRDSTGERNAIAELNREVRRCPVTGLPNRRAFMEELDQRLVRSDRFVLLLVDLDGFKQVNDRFGHAMGDRVITRVGFRLRTADPGLFASRLGGDEFAILADGDDAEAAMALARLLIEAVDQPARFGDAEIQVGAAVGVALSPGNGTVGEDLLRAADLALLSAKGHPGSHVCLFTPELKLLSARNAGVDSRVRAALRAGNIDVAYQPMIDLETGQVVALEALARWQPDGGEAVAPDELVRIAEARGLVATLRRLVLEQAAAVVANRDPSLNLWINASVHDLRQPGMVDEVLAELASAGLAPHRLALEVTETALMTDEDACRGNIELLNRLGVGVAMDDFGAGFSSLDRLRRLPINALKISGSLLSGAPGKAAATDIFRVAASLGHSMDLMLVAEGVESREELELARAAGIHRVQGFALSPPVPANRISDAIAMAEAAALAGLRLRAAS